MSFFKRNDPNAPAARRTGAQGGGASPSPYERLPADNSSYSSMPRQPSPQPPQLRRVPPPPHDFSQSSAGYDSPTPARQQPQQFRGHDSYDREFKEKAELRPEPFQRYGQGGQGGYGQAVPSGYGQQPGQGGHGQGVTTGTGRGV